MAINFESEGVIFLMLKLFSRSVTSKTRPFFVFHWLSLGFAWIGWLLQIFSSLQIIFFQTHLVLSSHNFEFLLLFFLSLYDFQRMEVWNQNLDFLSNARLLFQLQIADSRP